MPKDVEKKNAPKKHWVFGGGTMHPHSTGNFNRGNKKQRPPETETEHRNIQRVSRSYHAERRAEEDVEAGRTSTHAKSASKPRPKPKPKLEDSFLDWRKPSKRGK